MGYIGLLLNAPYKIDSMVWMRLGLCCDSDILALPTRSYMGYINQAVFWSMEGLNVNI
jgi:hypothetical protein